MHRIKHEDLLTWNIQFSSYKPLMPPYLHFNIHHFIKRLDPVQSRCSKLSPESRRISDALLVKFIPVCSNMVELWWSVFFREERRRFSAKNGRNPCRDQPSRNEQTRHDFVCSRGYWNSPSCLPTRNTYRELARPIRSFLSQPIRHVFSFF